MTQDTIEPEIIRMTIVGREVHLFTIDGNKYSAPLESIDRLCGGLYNEVRFHRT